MKDNPDGLLATFKAEWNQTKWLLRFGAVGTIFIVTWGWAGNLFLSSLIVGAVNLLAVLILGSGIAVFVMRIMYASKRWQFETTERSKPPIRQQSPKAVETVPIGHASPAERNSPVDPALNAAGGSRPAPASTLAPKSDFHKVHFMLRLQEEVERARREGSEMAVVWLGVTLPGRDTAEQETDILAAEVAKLLADQAKTVGQPLNLDQSQYVFSLPGQGRASSAAFVSKLVRAMGNYWCNCGIAIYPKDGTSAQALFDRARQICEESGPERANVTDLRRAA